ncbi:MAG: MBL fold metallo-hydrolase [Bacteroidales bacterium]|nr:MBL fold metallo-hydrolase [Bacteroidales bacterium]
MHLHYIYHSCFVLSEEDFLIVYDYWCDPDTLLPKFLDETEREQKAVYFIVSHFHEDHFNPVIVEWCKAHASEDWHLLPSYDTVRRRRIDKNLPLAVLRFGESVQTPHFTLQAYRSTDVGVSTVATLRDGTTVFHAGDCNNWRFPLSEKDGEMASHVKVTDEQMEKLFLSIVRDIRKDHPRLDHAMFPVDPRLGQEMLRGPLQFLKAVEVRHFHPMHYCSPSL